MESKSRKSALMHKWSIWTVLMPYYSNAFESYLLLNQFDKTSRKELMKNFRAFRNSMSNYRKDIYLEDEINVVSVEEKLQKAKKYPLMLVRINIPWIYRISTLEALHEFEEWFEGVEEIGPDPYTEDFQKVDHSFLSTNYQFGRLTVDFEVLHDAFVNHKSSVGIFKAKSIIPNHIHVENEYFKKCISEISVNYNQEDNDEDSDNAPSVQVNLRIKAWGPYP